MMKYPGRLLVFNVFCIGLLPNIFGLRAEARIGESKESIERRLFSSGGIVYRDDAIEANRRKGMPYLKYFELLPSSAELKIYFKTVDGSRPASSELREKRMLPGWDLHVVYIGGKSMIEVYKRSQGMSEYELNELLARQAGGSFWRKAETGDEKGETALGYNMERDDGHLRARKLGADALMIFDAKTDGKLAQVRDDDLQEKAPLSVAGF